MFLCLYFSSSIQPFAHWHVESFIHENDLDHEGDRQQDFYIFLDFNIHK